HIEGIANKDTTVNITPLTFDGFTVVVTKAIRKISGLESETSANPDGSFDLTIDKSGSELYIFYTRNAYNFTVRYLRYNTNEPLHDDLILKNWEYGSTVTANAIDIGGMTCVSPLTQSAAVRSNEVQNVIIFYYSDLQYTVEYKVWDNGGGTLSSTIEVKEGTDDFIGSTAAADAGYKFDGWYLDPECTVSADSKATVTDNKLVPITAELSPMPTVNTFYAKFTRLYGTLTIKRDNAADEGGGTQTFIYRITDKNDPANVFYATVTGNNSKTVTNVPCGNYTVEQLNVWSWRYSDSSQEVSVDTGGKTVTFNKAADKEYWLSGSAESKINKRSGG
ncbi:MAG: InlB B-repeat-containing protein, partial [Acutalibacteraceae bacterium]